MAKDLKTWSALAEKIQARPRSIFFRQREVWWCILGANIGDEEDGRGTLLARPVIVIKKFNSRLFWGIPLTTAMKQNPYYLPIVLPDGASCCAIISQLRTLDAKRLTTKIGTIDFTQYNRLILFTEAILKSKAAPDKEPL